MDFKAFSGVEIKSESEGRIVCVFRVHNVVDSDGEVTTPGSFTDGAEVDISPWQHRIWEGELPVGKGVIRSTPTECVFEGTYFMGIPRARVEFETLKARGRSEWSFGFFSKRREGTLGGEAVTYLYDVTVLEVSPVLRGAMGPGRTRLVAAKDDYRSRPVEENTRAARLLGEIHFAERDLLHAEMTDIHLGLIRAGLGIGR